MARVPNSHTAVRTTGNKLRSAKLGTFASNTVNLVSHVCVRLNLVLLLPALNVVNDQLAFVVDGGDVAHTDRRGFEGGALQAEFFLPLGDERQAAPVELVDVEDALRRGTLSEETEAGALRNPLDVEGREGEALGGVLNDLRCFSSVHLNFKFPIDSIIVLEQANRNHSILSIH